jgi:hypothetical protein
MITCRHISPSSAAHTMAASTPLINVSMMPTMTRRTGEQMTCAEPAAEAIRLRQVRLVVLVAELLPSAPFMCRPVSGVGTIDC